MEAEEELVPLLGMTGGANAGIVCADGGADLWTAVGPWLCAPLAGLR